MESMIPRDDVIPDGYQKDCRPSLHGRNTTIVGTTRLSPRTQQTAGLRIVTFTSGQVRDVENVIASELEGLTEGLAKFQLLLDFCNVVYITSAELGTLIGLHRKMKDMGGRLALFNVNAQVLEVFKITRLDTLLGICT
jgi:anti-sigma B factor antagonist